MKTTHIIILVLIAAAIAALVQYSGDLSTYETIASAKESEGKFVTIMTKLDKERPIHYDPVKDPNYLTFNVVDTLGGKIKVIYHDVMPTDMDKSERLVLKGRVKGTDFECTQIVTKCPSKYKDDPNAMKQFQTANEY